MVSETAALTYCSRKWVSDYVCRDTSTLVREQACLSVCMINVVVYIMQTRFDSFAGKSRDKEVMS